MHVVLTCSDNIWEVPLEPPGEKLEIKGKNSCSGSVVEVFSWLYTGDGFRQRKICMAEWGILEEGAHKQRYCIYTHACP